MDSWWQLGERRENVGKDLDLNRVTCPFCTERGNFSVEHHAEKRKPNSEKKLNFDTLKCGSCASYVMVLWSASKNAWNGDYYHDFRVLPWPLKLERYPEHWPEAIGRYWLQAKRNIRDESWEAAGLMARGALQGALRNHGAKGDNLKKEIADFSGKGILPPIMKEWSEQVRLLGNELAHPGLSHGPPDPQDVRDIVSFLDFLLKYLYDLPCEIEKYRERSRNPV